jgi:prepilin-type processing-associated H-X9-DG protein
MILPFMESQTLYDTFNLKPGIWLTDAVNSRPRSTQLPVMLCPTETHNETPFSGSTDPAGRLTVFGDNWARGNYAANASLGSGLTAPHGPAGIDPLRGNTNCAFGQWTGWNSRYFQGVMGANMSIGLKKMLDGASHTVIVGEIRTGLRSYDMRGIWAMPHGSSSLWGHGYMLANRWGPNPHVRDNDGMVSCVQLQLDFGGGNQGSGADFLQWDGMGCYDGNNGRQQCGSMHPGGVNVCLADGSVHFIGDFIDASGDLWASPPFFSVWDKLMLSKDDQTIPDGSY